MTQERAVYGADSKQGVRQECRLPFADERYQAPTPAEVRAIISHLRLTGSEAGRLTGVNGRTIRKWTGDASNIPYAAWRLLLIEARWDLEGRSHRKVAST